MKYKVSVIIPTYNAEKFIKNTIESVINQTIGFENLELIIVDDNSNDLTRAIIKEFSQKFSNIKYVFLENNSGTPSRGRNLGIDTASSNYIMFLDQDDRYVNSICKVLYDVIEETNVDIAMCNHKIIFNNDFENYGKLKEEKNFKIYSSTEEDIIFNDAYMWNKIFRKDFLNKFNIRCFEKYWGEDSYFCIKSYLNTDKVVYLENYQGYFYNVRDSKGDSSNTNNYMEEDFDNFLKGFYKIVKLIKDKHRQDLINMLMKKEFVVIISQFVRLKTGYQTKIIFLEELYKFQEFCNFNERLNEKWADIILKNIKKRNFVFVLIFSRILNLLYNSRFLRKIYRKFTNKF